MFWLLNKKGGGREENTQKGNPVFGPHAKSEEGRAANARPGYPHFRHPLTAAEEKQIPKGSPRACTPEQKWRREAHRDNQTVTTDNDDLQCRRPTKRNNLGNGKSIKASNWQGTQAKMYANVLRMRWRRPTKRWILGTDGAITTKQLSGNAGF